MNRLDRLPVAPVLALASVRVGLPLHSDSCPFDHGFHVGPNSSRQCLTDGGLAELFEVHRRTISRWKRVGLDTHAADHSAFHLDLHPAEVWGTEW